MMHPRLEQHSHEQLAGAALNYLVDLLHKLSMAQAAKELMLYVPTLHRILDEDTSLEDIKKLTACHIIFMCETNHRLIRILSTNPRHNAYYPHPRIARLVKRYAALEPLDEILATHKTGQTK